MNVSNPDRLEAIAACYRNKETLREIGGKFGITGERVRQLLKKARVDPEEGGGLIKNEEARKRKAARWLAKTDASLRKVYGCGHDEFIALNGTLDRSPGTAAWDYQAISKNNKGKGAEWSLTFPEYVGLWEKVGGVHMRGRGYGSLALCRKDTSLPFQLGNVEIKPAERMGVYHRRKRQTPAG